MKCSVIKKIIWALLLVMGSAKPSFSDNLEQDRIVYNFSDNWLRYDKYYESYLPLKNKELKKSKSIHQILSFEKYKNYNLKFKATKGLTLFINNKLQFKKIQAGEEEVNLALNTFSPDEKGELVVTFFHPQGALPFYSTVITNRSAIKSIREEKEGGLILFLSRNVTRSLSGYVLLFITIATLFVIFKQVYPKEYIRYFSFTLQENSDHLLPGSFSIPSLWMALINGLALALLIYMLGLNEIIFTSSYTLFKGTLLVVMCYFVFYIGKYLYLWLIAWLFNYSKIVPSQFAEYIRFFERVSLLACLIVFGFVASGFITVSIKSEILYYSLIAVLVFCVIKVIFLFLRLISHRNLYLFSYICAAEILPLIIAVKILLF